MSADVPNREHVKSVFRQLFDAHPAHVCMLDLDGRIVAVNEAWTRFGQQNNLSPDHSFEGNSYLDACSPAAEAGDQDAQDALTGLLDVLATGRPKFSMIYPCHAPWERRWFKLWIEPQMPETPVVIVAHQLERAERVGEVPVPEFS